MALTKITSNVVKDDAVTSAKIVDGGIATADIAANAVTSAKIAQNSILTKHIDDGQVTTDQLGADAVTAAKIADDAISEEHLDVTVITSLSEITAATGDLLMVADISDSNNLKKIPVSSILAGTHTGSINTSGTISSGAITSSGNLHAGDGTNISMDSSANGQIEADGNGYQGAIALDGSAMHVYHNSSSRDLVLGTNETARLTISGTGGFNFESNPVEGITSLSSGAITTSDSITSNDGSGSVVISGDSNSNTYIASTGEIRIRPSGTTINKFVIGSNGNLTTAGTISSGAITSTGTVEATRLGLGVAPHASAALNITSTNQNIRLNNGSELGIIDLDSNGRMIFWSHGDSSNNEILFYQGTGSGAEKMRIHPNGNVGIATQSPRTRLNVQSSVGASSYTGVGPGDLIRASGSGQGNWIASEDDGAMAYFGVDALGAKFAGYNYATTTTMDVIIGQSTFTVKPQHFEVSGNTALTGSFNSTHSNGPYIRFQESGADKFYIGASSAVSGGTYTGYDLYAPAGKTIQIFSEGRSGSLASLQVKSDHIVLTQDINTSSTAGSNVVVGASEEGAVHLITETGNGRATGITFKAGTYGTQSAITSVHNTSEGTNVSIHTTDSYNSGPKERFRFDHHGHARGVSFRGTKTAQPAFALGGGDVIRQNLKLYYNFADSRCYGTSGSTVTDLSGNSNTGNLGANVSYSSTVGGIMDFAGGNTNNGAFIGTPLTLPTTDSVSLMFWIYYDDQPASPGDYQLMGWQANGGYAYFGVAANGGSYGYIGRSSNIAENDHIVAGQKWHHLCVTRDAGDGSNGRSYTYIDGILTGFRKSEDPYAHSQTMTVGALGGASNGSGSAGHTLDGKIASVAVYDRALTQPEIWHNMMVDIHRLVGT